MYSFGPIPRQKRSGRVIGTHQKIDRIARQCLRRHIEDDTAFPSIKQILHFEGSRGPDGIKLKSPGKDEPWHFINPHNPGDDELLVTIGQHRHNLIRALQLNDEIRAAFEAAWLAHAITDGLTPAHHEPYEAQVSAIGKHTDERQQQVRGKIVMSGSGSRKDFVRNNWKYWGARGLLTTHTLFEAGVATTAKPLRFSSLTLPAYLLEEVAQRGFETIYVRALQEVAEVAMYEQFKRHGWTRKLAQQTKQILLPTIMQLVALAWYDCYQQAKAKRSS